MSTIQVDFNQPARFGLEYNAADGTRQQPVMIHRALFGSIERFFGVLTEHYAGAFPAWLAPVQVVGIPIPDEQAPVPARRRPRLRQRGIRVEVDDSDDRMQKKIRTAQQAEDPVHAARRRPTDAEAGTVSFRYRDGSQRNGVPVDEAVEQIAAWVQPPGTTSIPPRRARPPRRKTWRRMTDGIPEAYSVANSSTTADRRRSSSTSGRRTGWPTSAARASPRATTTARSALSRR